MAALVVEQNIPSKCPKLLVAARLFQTIPLSLAVAQPRSVDKGNPVLQLLDQGTDMERNRVEVGRGH